MVSTFSPNVQLEEPARGDDVGVWDTPVNNNMTLLDLIVGAITTISGAAGSVVLSAAQFQSKTITFNSTLLASITITFPTSFKKSYEVYNTCTGSSAFTITLQTTASGGQVICAVPGQCIEVWNDGTNINFKNFGGPIGSYFDFAGSSVPNWVSGCTVAPYLACTGGTFSSSTYPVLASILGSTTLPDARGRARLALDAGVGRVSSSITGLSSVGTGGGSQTVTLASSQLPASIPYNDPQHTHSLSGGNVASGGANFPGASNSTTLSFGPFAVLTSNSVGITINPSSLGGGGAAVQLMQPSYIGGLTLIRAA